MLDLRKVGAYISVLRKQNDMTQVELADILNVSHQAVSKWERGESMPDVGTLPKLSEVFNKSIDDILAGGEPSASKAYGEGTVIKQLAQNKLRMVAEMINNGDVDLQSVVNIAPILKPSVVDEVVQKVNGIDMKHLSSLAPFLNSDTLTKLVDHVMDNSLVEKIDGGLLAGVAPFVGRGTLNMLTDWVIEGSLGGEHLMMIAPFLDREKLDRLVDEITNDRLNEDLLSGLAPFVSSETLGRLVERVIDGNIRAETLAAIAPFLGREHIRKVVKSLSVGNLNGEILAGFAPFIDRDTLSKIVNNMIDNAKRPKKQLNDSEEEG